MKHALALMTVLTLFTLPGAAHASTGDDGFGNTYFNAQSPAAFGDNTEGNALSAATSDADGNDVSKIEPAAGDGNVFTLPEDPSDVGTVSAQPDTLTAPSKPIIPGMTVPNNQP
jgi:hypothetical protein